MSHKITHSTCNKLHFSFVEEDGHKPHSSKEKSLLRKLVTIMKRSIKPTYIALIRCAAIVSVPVYF